MRVRKGFIYILLTAAAISLSPCHAARAAEPDREELNLMQAANEMRASGRVQLNFKDVEIVKFLRFMSELLGENILVDPGITGTVSVVSPKAVTLNEAREVMLSVLEMNNLILEQMDGYSKVTPASGGAVTTGSVVKSDRSVAPGEAVIVQVVPLNYVKAGYVVSPLKTAIKEIQVSPVGNGSSVLLVGKASLLNRAVSVIRALDAPDSIRAIKVVPLSYANAKLLEAQMNAMGKDASSKMAGLMAVADERTGRIVLIGSAQGLREAERVIKELDLPSRTENFHVYKLHNADAKTVAEQLSQILATAAKLSPDKEGGVPSTVVPDLPTNSLIFTASQEQYNSLKSILEQLDTQPKQVMLRGLIAEVSLNKLNSAGIDWAAWGGDIMGDKKPEVWDAMARAIKKIDKVHVMTFHPRGRTTSAWWYNDREWMDFNMFQSGHRRYGQRKGDGDYTIKDNTEEDNWRYVDMSFEKEPLRPVIDGEPSYEDIPQGLHDLNDPRWMDYDVRRYAYWAVFGGAFGHTYGHNSVMQFIRPGLLASFGAEKPWWEAMEDPGYNQMKYLKWLMLNFPFTERIADQSCIAGQNGERYDRVIATRGNDYMLVYNYSGKPMSIDLTKISGAKKNVWWMNPANGELTYLGEFDSKVTEFSYDAAYLRGSDRVLIAVDSSKNYISKTDTQITEKQ